MPSLLGSKANQVSTNGDLGTLAFQDSNAVNITGGVVDVSAGTAALPTLGTTGDPNTGVFFPAADTVAVATNGVERVRVDSSGNLGVGITPSYRLDVAGASRVYSASGASPISYWWSGGGYRLAINMTDGASGIAIYNTLDGNAHTWQTSSTERMRLDANGSLNILRNTTTFGLISGSALQVMGGNGSIGTYNQIVLGYNPAQTNAPAAIGYVTTSNTGSTQGDIVFGTRSGTADIALTEVMRIKSSGHLLVGTTSATSGGAKLQTADGITFPATQVASANANTLDDYEEGTWTPSLGGIATYTTQTGIYTKVGNLVTVSASITVNVLGTGSINTISGLPFTSAAGTGFQSGSVFYFAGLATNAYFVSASPDVGSTSVKIAMQSALDGTMDISSTVFGNGTRIDFGCTYRVA